MPFRRLIRFASSGTMHPRVLCASAQTSIATRRPIMIAIIAVLCSVSFPADCDGQTVITSDFADVSMQSCWAHGSSRLDESASDLAPLRHGAA